MPAAIFGTACSTWFHSPVLRRTRQRSPSGLRGAFPRFRIAEQVRLVTSRAGRRLDGSRLARAKVVAI